MTYLEKAISAARASQALTQQSDYLLIDFVETRDRVAAYHANLEWRGIAAKPKRSPLAELLTRFCAWGM